MLEIGVLVLSIALCLYLGLMVWLSDKNRLTSKFFVAFCVSISAWSLLTYWSNNPAYLSQTSIARLVMLFAVLQLMFIYLTISTFPKKKTLTVSHFRYILAGLTVAFVTQTPLVFQKAFSENGQVTTIVGPGLILFSLFVVGSLVMTLTHTRKSGEARAMSRSEHKLIILGLSSMYGLIILSNFALVLLFDYSGLAKFGPAFPLIFAAIYTYTILTHKTFQVPRKTFELTSYTLSFMMVIVLPLSISLSALASTAEDFWSAGRIVTSSVIFVLGLLLLNVSKRFFDHFTDPIFRKVTETTEKRNQMISRAVESETKSIRLENTVLEQRSLQKDEFISLASHQLRTPISIASLNNKMLLDGVYGSLEKEQKTAIDESQSSIERMQAIVDELLEVARIDQGTFKIETSKVNFKRMVQETISIHQATAESKSILITCNSSGGSRHVDIDQTKIAETISNYIDNAIKYSPPNKEVVVGVDFQSDRVQVTVKDEGIGVPAKERGELFTKFGRSTRAKKADPNGMGLGLFLAHKTVELHGGETFFKPNKPKGSVFGFWLPLK